MKPKPNRESLILSHMPQVEFLARRLHRRCLQVHFDDRIEAGAIGLIRAIDRLVRPEIGNPNSRGGYSVSFEL